MLVLVQVKETAFVWCFGWMFRNSIQIL